jgi:ribonuclease D
LPTYLISSNTELLTIAKVKPKAVSDLMKIRGFAGQKIAKHGEDIIALLNSVS